MRVQQVSRERLSVWSAIEKLASRGLLRVGAQIHLSLAGHPHFQREILMGCMAESGSINGVERGTDYFHVRFRDPDDFVTIRTPDWAANAAQSVLEGSEVRTGDEAGNDDWTIQSVLIPRDAVSGKSDAKEIANRIVEKLDS